MIVCFKKNYKNFFLFFAGILFAQHHPFANISNLCSQHQISRTADQPATPIFCKQLDKLRWFAIPKNTRQILLVTATRDIPVPTGQLQLCQKIQHKWQAVNQIPMPVVLGKKGLAPFGEKHEGDLKTPTGLYPLGEAFGYFPFASKMDYRYITLDDKYIDDSSHADYNTWVHGTTTAKSFEQMRRDDNVYKLGIVINYNRNPVVPAAGSAIFMHIWRGPQHATLGCVALSEHNLKHILLLLDKAQNPHILIL